MVFFCCRNVCGGYKKSINFKELADIRLPKPEHTTGAVKDPNTLYDVEIVERDATGETVKIHYIGYSSR